MNRQQRRLSKSKRAKKKGLSQAQAQLGTALQALKQIEGLEGTVKVIDNVNKQLGETHQLLEAMVEDNQTMADELEALKTEQALQREVTLQLIKATINERTGSIAGVTEEYLRRAEERLRAEVVKESTCEGS